MNVDVRTLRKKYRIVAPTLTERSRRLWAAAEAQALGHGGVALVMRATGVSRSTVQRGLREVERDAVLPPGRARQGGGGPGGPPGADTATLT